MKKIVLMMVALLSMTAVQAQESDKQQFRGPRQMTPEQMTERMSDNLKLTDEQKTKVLALNKEYEKVIAGPGMRAPRPQNTDGESGAIYCWNPEYDYGENPDDHVSYLCDSIQAFIEGMIKDADSRAI